MIPSDFAFPTGAGALAAEHAQMALWASPAFPALWPYFGALETYFQEEGDGDVSLADVSWRKRGLGRIACIGAAILGTRPPRRKADILVVGQAHRLSDIRMMQRVTHGLVQTGASILYLVSQGSTEYSEVLASVAPIAKPGQVQFLDPLAHDRLLARMLVGGAADCLCRDDWELLQTALPPNVTVRSGVYPVMRGVAHAKLVWELLRDRVQFHTAIIRNHFLPFSASIANDAISRGFLTVTFQHGVVSTPMPFVPLVANRLVTFGVPSWEVLLREDTKRAVASSRVASCHDHLLAGCLFDEITLRPEQRARGTLLVFDQTCDWTGRFYGISEEFRALVSVVEAVAECSAAIRKIVIRAHPDNRALVSWLGLAARYPEKIEISHPTLTLSFDLARSSLALTLFSGAAVTAAACGVPAWFLWEPGWYYTPDLAGFAPHAFVAPGEAVERLDATMRDPARYREARDYGLAAAGAYYAGGTRCEFSQEFIDAMLAPVTERRDAPEQNAVARVLNAGMVR